MVLFYIFSAPERHSTAGHRLCIDVNYTYAALYAVVLFTRKSDSGLFLSPGTLLHFLSWMGVNLVLPFGLISSYHLHITTLCTPLLLLDFIVVVACTLHYFAPPPFLHSWHVFVHDVLSFESSSTHMPHPFSVS